MSRSALQNAMTTVDAHNAAIHEIHALPDPEARRAVVAEGERMVAEAVKANRFVERPTVARSIADIRAQVALMSAEVEASLVAIEASLGLGEV